MLTIVALAMNAIELGLKLMKKDSSLVGVVRPGVIAAIGALSQVAEETPAETAARVSSMEAAFAAEIAAGPPPGAKMTD